MNGLLLWFAIVCFTRGHWFMGACLLLMACGVLT